MTKDKEKQQLEKQFADTHDNEPSFSSSGTPLPALPETPSAPPEYLYEVQLPRVCCITLNETDKIRLLGVPPVLVSPIRNAITSSWGQIQAEQIYYGAHEFKLLGMPWRLQGNESITARTLIVSVLRTMAVNGWNMIQAADVSKKEHGKDALFFETIDPSLGVVRPDEVDMFAMSFNSSDKLRVIGNVPHSITTAVKQAIQAQWPSGIHKECAILRAHEFKLRGNPWRPHGAETVYSRMFLSQLLANIRAQGFKLYTSVDISHGQDEKHETETWVFRRVGRTWS
ncbi:MAG: hypothetical protein J3R72DRAFT_390213 [Linnemannia gamsii]|nr:hypothetical protein BGX24_012825 [Mortierella sp. AD032]KAK3827377.1 MAG: hypothetical protein J3R72DRAFT_390213 [Linnemannia gamsii]